MRSLEFENSPGQRIRNGPGSSLRDRTHRARLWKGTLVIVVLWLSPAQTAFGQSLRGRLLDSETESGISAAAVIMLDYSGNVVEQVSTSRSGTFSFESVPSGRYRLRASRIGYAEATTPAFDLVAGEVLEVAVRLSPDAVLLTPLTIVSERPALVHDTRLARWGYYDRKGIYGDEGMGFAHFIDGDEIRPNVGRVTDLFNGVPGIVISYEGGREVNLSSHHCEELLFFLDGARLRLWGEQLNRVLPPHDLIAIEVYPTKVGPAQYRAGCAVAFWTGVRPARP